MIQEQYISTETAGLLKEKGFPIVNPEVCTQSRVMRWLREHKDIGYSILIIPDGIKELHYWFEIYKIDNVNNVALRTVGACEFEDNRYNTYEEAVDAAILYCLNNLIDREQDEDNSRFSR